MTLQSVRPQGIGLKLFDEPHVAEIIVFVHRNPGCPKTAVYKNVARGDRMNMKLDILEREGIIEMAVNGRRSSIRLTEAGESIASHLLMISEILGSEAVQ